VGKTSRDGKQFAFPIRAFSFPAISAVSDMQAVIYISAKQQPLQVKSYKNMEQLHNLMWLQISVVELP